MKAKIKMVAVSMLAIPLVGCAQLKSLSSEVLPSLGLAGLEIGDGVWAVLKVVAKVFCMIVGSN